MRSLVGSVLRAISLAGFAVSLLLSLPLAARNTRWRIEHAAANAGEDAKAARLRFWGAPRIQSIDRIRRAIPADGSYLLLDGSEEREGATFWVRYELAPRKARYVGRLSEIPSRSELAARLPAGMQWVVIAFDRRPAVLLERDQLMRRLERPDGPR